MEIRVQDTEIRDLKIITPGSFQDDRGFFVEVFREDVFREAGLPLSIVQENHSGSEAGVLRGLHFQWDPPMGKLMRVTRGEAFLVAVDIRKRSPTLGRWFGLRVDEASRKQVWAPAGFARGFCVLSERAEIQYLCTGTYNSAGESGIRWDDTEIGIEWPIDDPILSKKDMTAQSLSEWLARSESDQFQY